MASSSRLSHAPFALTHGRARACVSLDAAERALFRETTTYRNDRLSRLQSNNAHKWRILIVKTASNSTRLNHETG